MFLYRLYLFLICCFLSIGHIAQPMEHEVDDLVQGVAALELGANDSYDSDSEDEDGYVYKGLPALTIPDDKQGKNCIPLSRGIHFVPASFTREQRSSMRRADDAGKDIFSSAAYDLAGEPLGSDKNKEKVREKAVKLREIIKSLPTEDRNVFQEIYSNQYDKFHKLLGTDSDGGVFKQFTSKKNPQSSTAENFLHSGKYGIGFKFLGKDVVSLDPDYDTVGKPKHPYLGKLFVILINEDQLDELAPYFVVHGHANGDIKISNYFRKDVLAEREVSMPGFIPGDCVIASVCLRAPSFVGDYKSWYLEKFGISKLSYMKRQKLILSGKKKTVSTLFMDVILPHIAEKMKAHIQEQCTAKNITLVYKQLDGSFGQKLPALFNATDYRNRIIR